MIELRPLKDNETIAIAIATKNRPTYLAVLLTSIIQQTYTNWMMVINDQSDVPVEENDTLKDLFALIENTGHPLKTVYSKNGWERHQKSMEAVPESIEFILRIDDDMLPNLSFLESILKPFRFFPNKSLAAVGGCFPEPFMKPIDLDVNLIDPSWVPKFDEPTWKLQGHHYFDARQMIEVETLNGCAICYRRSTVEDVGGWAVEGYSHQAHREESDLCARLFARGYDLMMTTEAIAWHLYAPGGGSREVKKTKHGNFLVSDKRPIEADERLFWERIGQIKANTTILARKELRRYDVGDLESKIYKDLPLVSTKGILLRSFEKTLLSPLRRLWWYFSK
jgi:GT2 family glycosyltransferase